MTQRRLLSPVLPLILLAALASCSSPAKPRARAAKAPVDAAKREHLTLRQLAAPLERAAAAWPLRDPAGTAAYNAAVADFTRALQLVTPVSDWSAPVCVRNGASSWEVSFDRSANPELGGLEWTPSVFEKLVPASEVPLKGYDKLVASQGAGFPVVLVVEDTDRIREKRSYRPGNGIYVPGTVVLEFGRPRTASEPVPVRMRILNTYDQTSVTFAGRKQPLARNVTAGIELSLNNAYIKKSGLKGLLRPDRRQEDAGLFGIDRHHRGRIPVVFVHGLQSDAHIWKNAANDIYANPDLAARIQPLFFLYPTGISVPGAAARLRDSITQYRKLFDPEKTDPAMDQMVLVGHSMGGLVSRLQVTDPGQTLRRSFFSRPPSEVPWITNAQARQIEAALVFTPRTDVSRAVFVAVPHRGSEIADWRLVRLFVRFIRLPGEIAQLATTALTQDSSIFNPALLSYHRLGIASVNMLSPGHPFLTALDELPVGVPFHTIVGDRGKGDFPDGSDGVVPHSSSILRGARSELVVPYGHGCTEKTETVTEITRILRQHAGLKNAPPAQPQPVSHKITAATKARR
jgi:pimeloyl-ACP methyl ester carboxylesterase